MCHVMQGVAMRDCDGCYLMTEHPATRLSGFPQSTTQGSNVCGAGAQKPVSSIKAETPDPLKSLGHAQGSKPRPYHLPKSSHFKMVTGK